MSYIGQQPTSTAFLTDTFSGNGSTTAFTLSAAPAGTSSILVAISGVVQDPSTYSVVGTTLTFSPAPPPGTGNISVRFLGIPASGVTTTAYRTVTEFTATAGQTTFSVPSYTPGFIDVYRNGVMLGSADYTASNGVSVVLASGATAGDLVEVISMQVSSVLNAIPSTAGSVSTANIADSAITTAKIANSNVTMAKLDTQAQYTGFKNRIINGAMMIDQRNNGASVTSNGTTYTLDRWQAYSDSNNKYSVQQISDAPTGFTNSLRATSLSAYTVGTNEVYGLFQYIEGFNVADLGFGASGASPVTISFWVKSSLTGTFGGSILNNGFTRAYPFTYTISAANTWEQKTVTITGDTTGTWLKNNGVGLGLILGLGCGSGRSATAGSWTGTNLVFSATGATSLVGTNGATWQVTGVQLEKGSTATSFDYRPYGTEFDLCRRYYEQISGFHGTTAGTTTSVNSSINWYPKRASPTLGQTAAILVTANSYGSYTQSSASISTPISVDPSGGLIGLSNFSGLPTNYSFYSYTPTGKITLSAEL